MSIFDLFRGQPAQQQGQQQAPQNPPHIQNNPTVPQGNEPSMAPKPGEQAQPSPTDKFKDLWNTTNQGTGTQAPNFKLSQEQLSKVTSGMNFGSSVSREDLAKIAQGGQEAVEALGNVLNAFGREVFSTSAQFSSHLTEAGYNTASKIIDNGLPGAIKSHLTQEQLFNSNPQFRDPALQPLVGALQAQFQAQRPNATPTEIQDLVHEYMNTVVVGAFKPKEAPSQQSRDAKQADFSSFVL